MPELDALDATTIGDMADWVGRLKHDLGKYISFQARWLEADAGSDARRQALRDDLLRTRRGPAGEASAAAVWRSFQARLDELPPHVRSAVVAEPAWQTIASAMRALEPVTVAVAGDPPDELVDRGLDLAASVSSGCRALLARVTALRGELHRG